jgi:predicted DNA-binding protein YlxM (UPF0122 family)
MKTNKELYIEYVNDWLTIKRMAEHYNIPEKKLSDKLKKGKEEHEQYVYALKKGSKV